MKTKIKKSKKVKILQGIIISLIIVLLGVTVFLFRYQINVYSLKRVIGNLGFNKFSNGKFETIDLAYDTALSPVFGTARDIFILACGNKIVLTDFGGDVAYEESVQFLSPAIHTAEKQYVVFDRGGREYRRFSGYSLAKTATTENAIIDMKVNRYGEMLSITGSTSHKCAAAVYDQRGKEIYKYEFADDYVVCGDLADDGKKFALASLKTIDGEITSTIAFYSIKEKEPQSKTELDGELIISADYKSNGNIAVITDKAVYSFSASGSLVDRFDFAGRSLQFFDRSDRSQTAVVLNKNQIGSSTNLCVIDANAKKVSDIFLGIEVKSIIASNQRVLLLSGDKLIVYDVFGEKTDSIITSGDLRTVLLSKQYGAIGVYIDRVEPIAIK